MKQCTDDRDDLFCSVFAELKSLGVKCPKGKKFKSTIPKQEKLSICSNKIFGVCLCDQEKILDDEYQLPKFIVATTSYLKKFCRKEIGLFRKAGSIARQRDLRRKIERGESIEDSEPNDVASLLKQWLRELPEPLIPVYLYDLFLKCQSLEVEGDRVAALLLCCYLLPPDHLHTLKHLLDFLSYIAENSVENKMSVHNLAVIMAPNIFVMGNEPVDKNSNHLVQQHTSILEYLIINADKVGTSPPCSLYLSEGDGLKSDLDLSIDALDYSPFKSKKKRRSTGVQELFNGFRKLVSQNSTPPNFIKRLNEDGSRSNLSTVSGSASKRKADPEVVSMSPAKKKKEVPVILENGNLSITPNVKGNPKSSGVSKERTGSTHSRRKSFGLLRRKDKNRQKPFKPGAIEELKVVSTPCIDTPSPYQDTLSISFQKCLEPKVSKPQHSPLLSESDIANILSKNTFVKKSMSDCYLTVKTQELKGLSNLLTSSSQVGLNEEKNKSAYYLRSDNSSKIALKRKSDVFIPELKCSSFDFATPVKDKSQCFRISPRLLENNLKQSVLNDQESCKTENKNIIADTKVIFDNNHQTQVCNLNSRDENDSKLVFNFNSSTNAFLANDLEEIARGPSTDFLNNNKLVLVSGQNKFAIVAHKGSKRISSQKKRYPGISKIPEVNITTVEESEDHLSKKVADSSNASTLLTPTVQNKQSEGKVRRKNSVQRQEAFIVKSRNRNRASLTHTKSADPAVFSNSKSQNITKYDIGINKKVEPAEKNDVIKGCDDPFYIPERKKLKRNIRNGSIIRGRPNTIRSGLPSEKVRLNSDTASINAKKALRLTSSVDNDLFLNVINHIKQNDHELAVALQIENLTLSSPPDFSSTEVSDTKVDLTKVNGREIPKDEVKVDTKVDATENDTVDGLTPEGDKLKSSNVSTLKIIKVEVPITTTQIKDLNDSKDYLVVPKQKSKHKLYSNSDSKVQKVKRKTVRVNRTSSFPEQLGRKHSTQKKNLKSVISTNPRKCKSTSSELEKENICLQNKSSASEIPCSDVFKTPTAKSSLSEENWVNGRQFLDAQVVCEEEVFNKRDSIAMIIKNNRGHVRSKVHLYDGESKGSISLSHTPVSYRFSTPGEIMHVSQHSSLQRRMSQRRNASSVKGTISGIRTCDSAHRYRSRYSPLPTPPKFAISDLNTSSPKLSSPLKEITNICSGEMMSLISSPEKTPFCTPMKEAIVTNFGIDLKSSDRLKLASNSFSGHTPYKLPKVNRSESSPVLGKVFDKSDNKVHGSLSRSPSLMSISDSLTSFSTARCLTSPMFRTKSSLSIEKLRPDLLIDEWHCEL